MEQFYRKKIVIFEENAFKEFESIPGIVKIEFIEMIEELEAEGHLVAPDGKKLKGTELFEMRVTGSNNWRCIYGYLKHPEIVIVLVFNKKSNKTPLNELRKAIKRFNKFK